ncbi:TIGR03618 family F420-dependent PPOX class oxidoreductase [Kribbella sindirgiensis]|uniref:TIGR03618 family F420-dependent PPOX class oxidoreductase n=1 Tax=Kribbella sindirgiensis TaxID=1124744 RepID=A0A4R0JAU2_9ACTN|nr:TIGR03618 family F420-dependent PPOX class oxidoreductase [Kribbella sindirgiensis]TCC43359.1 TIGR03618 family F420-dependent PPOX class oxidoreductase [Kribbella sindirgiensis]
MLKPAVRSAVESTSIAHLATVLPDGSPHSIPLWVSSIDDKIIFLTGPNSQKARNLRRDPRVALSLAPVDNPYEPVIVRGRVVEWIDGDAGWDLVDQIAQKYIGRPYGRDVERVVGVIEVDHQTVGVG